MLIGGNPTPRISKELEETISYLLFLAQKSKIDDNITEGLTHLKLQKILYFAQSAYLAIKEQELFPEDIQAWKYGPVIEPVYHKYKDKGNSEISIEGQDYDGLSEDKKEFIEGIWDLFSKYSTRELVNITHRHQPWIDNFVEGQNNKIPKEILKEYYKGIFEVEE